MDVRSPAEAEIAGALDVFPFGIAIVKDRRIAAVNRWLCRLVGYDREDALGRSVRDFYDSQEEFDRIGRVLYDTPASGTHPGVETRLRKKDGTFINIILSASLLLPGDPEAGSVFAVQDITERARAEEALRENGARFRRMMEQSPLSMQTFSPDGTLIGVNAAFEALWHVSAASVQGYNILRDPQVAALGFLPAVSRAFAGEPGSTPVAEYDAGKSARGGVRRIVRGIFYPVKTTEGAVSTVTLIHIDLTENMRAEEEKFLLQGRLQQAMKLEAVGRLAGGIAHDFNNLLTAITGNAEMAAMEVPPDGAAAQCIREISKASGSAATLTSRLLAFSRQQIIEPRLINLNALMARTRSMFPRLIRDNVRQQTVAADDLGSVRVDPGQFEHVLVALMANAQDAMPDGGTLTLETANRELDGAFCALHPALKPGRYVMLAVRDTGRGMSEEAKKHVFEPFFTTKPKARGTGLGLATVLGIVQQAGGTVEFDSKPGAGTEFRIYVPRSDGPSEDLSGKPAAPKAAGGTETVLLVEDESSVKEMTGVMLQKLGYTVLPAADGADALRTAEKNGGRIDLLLTDVVMRGMNGRELAEALRASHPEMKVLFTSGYTEDVIAHHGVLDQGLHFIAKPYTRSALAEKIREALS